MSEPFSIAETESEIRDTLGKMDVAWRNVDVDEFVSFYADLPDVSLIAEAQRHIGLQAVKSLYAPIFEKLKEHPVPLETTFVNIRVIDSSHAHVESDWSFTVNDRCSSGCCSLLMQKLDGHWRIVHDHSS